MEHIPWPLAVAAALILFGMTLLAEGRDAVLLLVTGITLLWLAVLSFLRERKERVR